MKVLITAFEPFHGEAQNSSLEVLNHLPHRVGEVEVIKLTLPVSFADAPEMAIAAIDRLEPQAVIALGQAGTRSCVNLERIALNMAHAKNPDNQGCKPCRQPVVAGGPDGIFSPVNVDALADALQAEGHQCAVSNTAGLYVCNTLYYRLLHRYAATLPVLFVHLPYTDYQTPHGATTATPMPLSQMLATIEALIPKIR
ncbi:MAG: hypothetical protein ACI4AM_01705 [Muribaculaceae bacterium]